MPGTSCFQRRPPSWHRSTRGRLRRRCHCCQRRSRRPRCRPPPAVGSDTWTPWRSRGRSLSPGRSRSASRSWRRTRTPVRLWRRAAASSLCRRPRVRHRSSPLARSKATTWTEAAIGSFTGSVHLTTGARTRSSTMSSEPTAVLPSKVCRQRTDGFGPSTVFDTPVCATSTRLDTCAVPSGDATGSQAPASRHVTTTATAAATARRTFTLDPSPTPSSSRFAATPPMIVGSCRWRVIPSNAHGRAPGRRLGRRRVRR